MLPVQCSNGETVHKLQSLAPDAPNFVISHFNNSIIGKALTNFHQYVTYPTRNSRCLNLCYGSIKGAYKSLQRAPLGLPDKCVVYQVLKYRRVLKKSKLELLLVLIWMTESVQKLRDCFSCKNWDLFINSCTNLDELSVTVTSYVIFYEVHIIWRKLIYVFLNNKLRMSKSVKGTINERNISFTKGDSVWCKELQRQVNQEFKLAKIN